MIRQSCFALVALVATAASASAQTVTGTVMYRERMMLPPGAVLEVTLQDVSRADAPAIAIATARLESPGAPPIRFVLDFDPETIHAGRRYAVRATITDRDRLIFTTTDAYPVLTQGHGAAADVLVRQVAQPAPPPAPEPERPASAAPVPGMAAPVASPRRAAAVPTTLATLPATFTGALPCEGCASTRVHLNLFPDDSFFMRMTDEGRTGPPRHDMGSWALSSDGRTLVIRGQGERTRQFALRDAISLRALDGEGRELAATTRHDLRRAARFEPVEVRMQMEGAYRMAGDVALFTECSTGRTWTIASAAESGAVQSRYMQERLNAGDAVLMTLEGRVTERPSTAAGPSTELTVDRVVAAATRASCVPRFAAAPLLRTTWRLTRLGSTPVAPAADQRNRPYLVFDDDTNRFSGAGGCNRLVGAYDVDGEAIAMQVAGTMMACPESGSESTFTAALRRAASFRIVGRQLSLYDAQGEMLARFDADGQ
jgi:uncharacterized lipoprotein YbaY/heat shock protein HslJ